MAADTDHSAASPTGSDAAASTGSRNSQVASRGGSTPLRDAALLRYLRATKREVQQAIARLKAQAQHRQPEPKQMRLNLQNMLLAFSTRIRDASRSSYAGGAWDELLAVACQLCDLAFCMEAELHAPAALYGLQSSTWVCSISEALAAALHMLLPAREQQQHAQLRALTAVLTRQRTLSVLLRMKEEVPCTEREEESMVNSVLQLLVAASPFQTLQRHALAAAHIMQEAVDSGWLRRLGQRPLRQADVLLLSQFVESFVDWQQAAAGDADAAWDRRDLLPMSRCAEDVSAKKPPLSDILDRRQVQRLAPMEREELAKAPHAMQAHLHWVIQQEPRLPDALLEAGSW